jgi:transposase
MYFYDLTSSYFEGDCAEGAAHSEHSKDHRPDCLQVVLGLLIGEKGLPFSWDVFRGNQGEAPTLITQLKKFKKRFGIEKALLVFDRGFLSHDNLKAVELAGYHYLTGLRAPQIETLLTAYPQPWMEEISTETAEVVIGQQKQWERFDETGFFSDLGIVNERKTVLLCTSSNLPALRVSVLLS